MIEFLAFVGFILPKAIPYIIGMLIWAILREIEKQKAKKPNPQAKPLAVKAHDSRVKPETEKRLYAMCGGDRDLVQRLTKGGGQAAWEKAIYDLERDRR